MYIYIYHIYICRNLCQNETSSKHPTSRLFLHRPACDATGAGWAATAEAGETCRRSGMRGRWMLCRAKFRVFFRSMALVKPFTTWWLIPLSKWVITPVISGLTLLIPFITGVKTHLRFVGSSPPSSDSYPSVTHGDFPIEMEFFQWDDHRSMQLQWWATLMVKSPMIYGSLMALWCL